MKDNLLLLFAAVAIAGKPQDQILITFDPAGQVIRSQALAGLSELRAAAADDVRQWSFRPVLRSPNLAC